MNIEQLLRKKFSLIPLQKDSKKPIIRWKKYQRQRAENEEIFNWYLKYGDDINIGIVCELSKIGVIDADDKRQLPELTKLVPEIWETTRVKTSSTGHLQFYFSTFGHKLRSTNKFLGLDGIEFRSKGRYVIAVGSIVSGVRYKYEKSLVHILPVPKIIIEKYKIGTITGITGDVEAPRVKSRCVEQILNFDLPFHKRKLAYFIAYCKMRIEGHKKSYAISLCKLANRKISLPLDKPDDFDFNKVYNYSCPRINEELSFVDCRFCSVRGGLKVRSLAMSNINKLKSLTNSERGVLLILDTYFRGLQPTIYEIQKYSDTKIDYYTIKRALKVLKEKEIIDW